MANWQELAFAQRMRDVITEIAHKEIQRIRPSASLATVDTIDTVNRTCKVFFPGDTTSVTVKMYTIQPITGGGVGPGDVVLVAGEGPARRVTEVVKGAPFMRAGRIAATAMETTASAANVFIDSVTGIIYRSTSSLRYKKNVEPADISTDAVMQLRAITYEPKYKLRESDEDRKYLGLIAEEIADIDDPALNMLLELDHTGKPDAVAYDRLGVVLLPIVQELVARVRDLEGRLDQA